MRTQRSTPPLYLRPNVQHAFQLLAEQIIDHGAKKATLYLSPRSVIKATRVGRRDRRVLQTSILYTLGRPNYAERKFIKRALKHSVKFPIKELQLRFDAKRKRK